MCRGKQYCTELWKDPSQWNIYCPLERPEWMDKEVNAFIDMVLNFSLTKDKEKLLEKISTLRNQEIQEWYIEHGQMSWWHRDKVLHIQAKEIRKDRDIRRSPKKYQDAVFERDGYRCRYCWSKLLSQKFIRTFIKKLHNDSFQRGKTNMETHGIIHLTWPVADHIIPWNLGWGTNMENLVSCCPPCNYWKAHYTLEQLGIVPPEISNSQQDWWDGLISKITEL